MRGGGSRLSRGLDWLGAAVGSSLLGTVSPLVAMAVLAPVFSMLGDVGPDRGGTLFLALAWWSPAEFVLSFAGLLLVGLPVSLWQQDRLMGGGGVWVAPLVGALVGSVTTFAFARVAHFPAGVTLADAPELAAIGAPFGLAAASWWRFFFRRLLVEQVSEDSDSH